MVAKLVLIGIGETPTEIFGVCSPVEKLNGGREFNEISR